MSRTIKQAWDQMIENEPVTAADISKLVRQVLEELVQASTPDNKTPIQTDFSKPTELGYGFSISDVIESPRPNTIRTTAVIQKRDRQPLVIGAQFNGLDRTVQVSSPHNQHDLIPWTPEHGPQKEWILQSLRKQIINYISQLRTTPISTARSANAEPS